MPNILQEHLGYDIAYFVQQRTPSDSEVYSTLRIPTDKYGMGLGAVSSMTQRGGKPRHAMSTLIQLALLGSPRRCLLGYEIVAILMGHFPYYRSATEDWKVSK